MMDDFKRLTDLLLGTFAAQDLADALGVPRQSFKQMRLGPDSAGRRSPPADWRARLRPLAERMHADLTDFLRE